MMQTLNAAFWVSYAESRLTCKFELDSAIPDFDRFEGGKNPIIYDSCWRPQMVRFYADSSLTCKLELNTAILNLERFEVSKNPIFQNSSLRPKIGRFLLVTLRAA